MRKKITILFLGILLITMNLAGGSIMDNNSDNTNFTIYNNADLDPLVDISVTVEIQAIRSLEKDDSQIPFEEFIDKNSGPDFYLKVIINNQEYQSDIWSNTKYVYNSDWSATLNVPDDQEIVEIKIQLWDSKDEGASEDRLCDISGDENKESKPITSILTNLLNSKISKILEVKHDNVDGYDAEIQYNIKTGTWTGDDFRGDISGYGRLNGCDDDSVFYRQRDCELWFNIFQNDYDNDGIPYWDEVNNFGSNPQLKDTGDPDNDKIPVEWEWKWGYNPFTPENHESIDPEGDSINNLEEFMTSEWYSDPYRKDVFVEMDMVGDGPNGEKTYFPEESDELIRTAFNRRNIMFHLDQGQMGGFDIIPFVDEPGRTKLWEIYNDYFLHGDANNWRRGVFHYGLVLYSASGPAGYMFRSNGFIIASRGHEKLSQEPNLDRDVVYASAYMHELGHTFSFWPIPGHNQASKFPYQLGWWLYRPYKSCMNYGYMYEMVDYSDGSRSPPDLNDWARIDYDAFEREW